MIAIYLYNLLNLILFPVYFLFFLIRILKNKDTIKSTSERLCVNMAKRPSGKLIWIHAASVGESMVAITLVQELNKKYSDYNYLITTGTLSSANILEKWLPSNAKHQFSPVDNLLIAKKFLSHWQPSLGIFIESELWPCLIQQASSRFDLMLINARLSDKSYKRWQDYKNIFQHITINFKRIIVQSKRDLEKYQNLGCSQAINLGNLKFTNKELDVNEDNLKDLQDIFDQKKVFVASSTHKEDEEVVLSVINNLKRKNIDYFPVIILRHPERRDELIKQCMKLNLSFSVRSQNNHPSLEDDLYIVDSFGELGLFYRLSSISFIGGSFKRGGHNLMEPAYFNNVIIFGPDMSNFQNIADDMIRNKAALQINDSSKLEEKVENFCSEKYKKEAMEFSNNALKFVANRESTLGDYISEISRLIK